MEFRLDADQVELQQTVARFFAARFPLDAMADARASGSTAGWSAMADLGVLGLLVAEDPAGAASDSWRRRSCSSSSAPTWCPGRCCGPCFGARSWTAPPRAEVSWRA